MNFISKITLITAINKAKDRGLFFPRSYNLKCIIYCTPESSADFLTKFNTHTTFNKHTVTISMEQGPSIEAFIRSYPPPLYEAIRFITVVTTACQLNLSCNTEA
jgi:hypothetical protein